MVLAFCAYNNSAVANFLGVLVLKSIRKFFMAEFHHSRISAKEEAMAREIDDMAKVLVTLNAQNTAHFVAMALRPSQVPQEILSRNCRLVSCYRVQMIHLNWFMLSPQVP